MPVRHDPLPIGPDAAVQVLALRVAADLIEFAAELEGEASLDNLIGDPPTFREAVFDTAGDHHQAEGLDLFDEAIFTRVLDEVRTLIIRARYGPAPAMPTCEGSVGPDHTLVRGDRYRVVHQLDYQRYARVSVLDFLAVDGPDLIFSARPLFGTTSLPLDSVREITRVDEATPIFVNRRA